MHRCWPVNLSHPLRSAGSFLGVWNYLVRRSQIRPITGYTSGTNP
jgi:hypothetical protein